MKILNGVKNGLAIAAFAIAGSLSFGAHAANATIDCCFVPGVNELQDTDADRILRGGSVVTTGQFQVGDVVQSLLRIDTVNSNQINGAVGSLAYQLDAVATLTITSIVDVNGGTCDIGDSCIARTSASVQVYEVPNNNNQLALAPAAGIAAAQAGTLILTLGTTASDDFWYIQFSRSTLFPNEIDAIAAAPQGSSQQGLYVFGVTATSNPGNIPFIPNSILDGRVPATCPACGAPTLHDFIGNGSGYAREARGVDSGWLLSTNATVLFNVPEPGSLALLGLALAATWFVGMRRKA